MHPSSCLVLPSVLALLAPLLGCDSASGELSLGVDGASTIAIENSDGPITLVSLEGAEVHVRWTVHSDEGEGTPPDAEVIGSTQGSTLQIAATTGGPETWVALTVEAPPELGFSLDSGAGDVVVEGMSAGGTITTTTGNISGAGLAGSLDVGADEAEVVLQTLIGSEEGIVVDVGEGPITLAVPESTDALLSASTAERHSYNCCLGTGAYHRHALCMQASAGVGRRRASAGADVPLHS